jgi:hypothetical protein
MWFDMPGLLALTQAEFEAEEIWQVAILWWMRVAQLSM